MAGVPSQNIPAIPPWCTFMNTTDCFKRKPSTELAETISSDKQGFDVEHDLRFEVVRDMDFRADEILSEPSTENIYSAVECAAFCLTLATCVGWIFVPAPELPGICKFAKELKYGFRPRPGAAAGIISSRTCDGTLGSELSTQFWLPKFCYKAFAGHYGRERASEECAKHKMIIAPVYNKAEETVIIKTWLASRPSYQDGAFSMWIDGINGNTTHYQGVEGMNATLPCKNGHNQPLNNNALELQVGVEDGKIFGVPYCMLTDKEKGGNYLAENLCRENNMILSPAMNTESYFLFGMATEANPALLAMGQTNRFEIWMGGKPLLPDLMLWSDGQYTLGDNWIDCHPSCSGLTRDSSSAALVIDGSNMTQHLRWTMVSKTEKRFFVCRNRDPFMPLPYQPSLAQRALETMKLMAPHGASEDEVHPDLTPEVSLISNKECYTVCYKEARCVAWWIVKSTNVCKLTYSANFRLVFDKDHFTSIKNIDTNCDGYLLAGYCYIVLDQQHTRIEAERMCLEKRMVLAPVKGFNTNKYLKRIVDYHFKTKLNTIPQERIWIGSVPYLVDYALGLDGFPTEFSNWGRYRPVFNPLYYLFMKTGNGENFFYPPYEIWSTSNSSTFTAHVVCRSSFANYHSDGTKDLYKPTGTQTTYSVQVQHIVSAAETQRTGLIEHRKKLDELKAKLLEQLNAPGSEWDSLKGFGYESLFTTAMPATTTTTEKPKRPLLIWKKYATNAFGNFEHMPYRQCWKGFQAGLRPRTINTYNYSHMVVQGNKLVPKAIPVPIQKEREAFFVAKSCDQKVKFMTKIWFFGIGGCGMRYNDALEWLEYYEKIECYDYLERKHPTHTTPGDTNRPESWWDFLKSPEANSSSSSHEITIKIHPEIP